MSSRNRACKSTGGNKNSSNNESQQKRKTTKSRFSLQKLPSSSSEDEAPTQVLNAGNRSSPGPSGMNRLRIESTDSDPDGPAPKRPQRAVRQQVTKEVEEESTSSSSTTSDSDEVPGRESIENENAINNTKKKPAPRNRRKVRKPSSSDYEDEVASSSTQKRRGASRLSQPRNISSLVNKCVYFLLIADQKKYAIKKADILKHIFHNQDKKLYGAVIEEANNVLKKTYGMEILASEKKRGEYLLINILNRDLGIHDFVELSPIELQKRGLVFYLLTVIFMNESSINETDLWEALKPLGVDVGSRHPHPIFGDVRKYLTSELVKQMYLEYKCISKDPPEFEFTWGERARQEIDKKDILEFACKIMGDTKPEDWILQYNDATFIGGQD